MSDDAAPFDIGWDESDDLPGLRERWQGRQHMHADWITGQSPTCGLCFNPWPCPWIRLAAAESSAAQALREREVLEGALLAMIQDSVDMENEGMDPDEWVTVDDYFDGDIAAWTPVVTGETLQLVIDALASLPSPEPTQPTTECAFPGCDCPGEFPVCEDFPAHLRNPLDPHGTAPEPTQGEQ